MSLSEKIEELLNDSRLIERFLKSGKLTSGALKKQLSTLEDLSDEHDELDIDDLLKELQNDESDEAVSS